MLLIYVIYVVIYVIYVVIYVIYVVNICNICCNICCPESIFGISETSCLLFLLLVSKTCLKPRSCDDVDFHFFLFPGLISVVLSVSGDDDDAREKKPLVPRVLFKTS